MANAPQPKVIFNLLDGMRGVAATCVMLYHFSGYLGPERFLPSAYLAVDLFFILSGFVIAHAYQHMLRQGRIADFTAMRLIRLWPLYALGTLLAAGYWSLRALLQPSAHLQLAELAAQLPWSLLFLPGSWLHDSNGLYPLVGPAWSLILELIVNLLFGLSFRFWTTRRVAWAAAAFGAWNVLTAVHFGNLDAGMTPSTLWGGLSRVSFSFFAGVLIYRLYESGARPVVPDTARWALPALVILMFAIDAEGPFRVAYDLVLATLAFPC